MMRVCQRQRTLVGILKKVIISPAVYPRFLEFLHVDIQSTGTTLVTTAE